MFGQNIPLQTIAVGSRHYCGLAVDGAAYCAGDYTGGVRGTGGATGEFAEPDLVPNQVAGGLSYSELAVGLGNSCGLSVGQAYCWGLNHVGQVGNGSTINNILVPVLVEGGATYRAISAGLNHACAIRTSGALYCWGSGQLGTGAPQVSTIPVRVHF